MHKAASAASALIPRPDQGAADPLAFRKRFGWEVQRRRLEKGWTQAELAGMVSLSLKYVGEIERGDANPASAIVEHLCSVLGWDLFGAKEQQMSALAAMRQFLLHEIDSALANLAAARRLVFEIQDPFTHELPASPRAELPPRPGRRRAQR